MPLQRLDVTLFGEYVDVLKSFFRHAPLEHAVIVIQYAKVKMFQGNYILQNVMYGTRLLLNPEINVVIAFRQRTLGGSSQPQPVRLSCDNIMSSDQNDFLDTSKTRVIANLKECNEDGSYVVYGTIVAVNNESDWWYLACKCNRAAKPDGAMYYCVHCSSRVFKVTPRYLIKLSVKDDSGTTTFLLFDREASNILNISCAELMEKCDLDGSFENPKEFDDLLLGKTYIFKVEDGEYAVYGPIKGVDGGADWFMPTCRCGSEVIPRNGFYYCSDCNKCVVNVIPSRQNNSSAIDISLVEDLKYMIDEHNVLAQSFRRARDFVHSEPTSTLSMRLLISRSRDSRNYNIPTADEVAALIVGDFDSSNEERDIIVAKRNGFLQQINETHPTFIPLQYPLLFPFGEDGYHENICIRESFFLQNNVKHPNVSAREFVAYRIQERENDGGILLLARRLYLQFLVDAYTIVEAQRIQWVKLNQDQLRGAIMSGILEAVIRVTQSKSDDAHNEVRDETEKYYDCRYVSACEASWRILSFDIHHRWPAVLRLNFHLAGQKFVTFKEQQKLKDVARQNLYKPSMFEA
ncbi:unnamed protein product [Cuscuta campestris]|uniref:Replication factor A C-terminal domain-containing protein n=1 Tax=Cuscuta campestris TaxID=132261 RepID=A0A484N7J7_9ASTE|nr:unnamed protein product [Cuscuta campestris]